MTNFADVRDIARSVLRRRILLLIPAVLFMAFAFLLPLAIMIKYSLTSPTTSLENYRDVLSSNTYIRLIWNTFRIAFLVTFVTLVISYPYAMLMARSSGIRLTLLSLMMLLPFLSSSVVRSFTWAAILQPNGAVPNALKHIGLSHPPLLIGNTTAVVIGMTQICMPYLVLPIYASLLGVRPEYRHAAASLGASRIRTFRSVTVPLTMPGIVAGCLLVAVYTMGSYVTPEVLGGRSSIMISQGIVLQIQTTLGFGIASTMGVVLMILTIVGLGIAVRIAGTRSVVRV
jgi:putative spermidine/putrescine transport system permease protein